MPDSKMKTLAEYGQSLWLDYIDRPLLETSKLQDLIAQGLRGMTSNPSIFQNAIGKTGDYDEEIARLKAEGKTTFQIYDELTIRDIQDATDQFLSVYESTNGLDGYVSLEINPQLANATEASIDEGKRLYQKVNRPNVMIKVPATDAGFPVIEELIGEGINVNVTLIFSVEQYEKTAGAYFNGLKKLAEAGGDLGKVRSVASVFVSRVDTAVDKLIDDDAGRIQDDGDKATLASLKGKAAVANSRLVYEKFKELFSGEEFRELFDKGANEQRVLWASTGTKNPDYSDIKYVTELISKPTVNTLPEKTLNAFLDHGDIKEALSDDVAQAQQIIEDLRRFDIDVDAVCADLLEAGVKAFVDAFESLFDSIEKKAEQLSATS